MRWTFTCRPLTTRILPEKVDYIYLNIAKNWTKGTWVNRSERLRGEPLR